MFMQSLDSRDGGYRAPLEAESADAKSGYKPDRTGGAPAYLQPFGNRLAARDEARAAASMRLLRTAALERPARALKPGLIVDAAAAAALAGGERCPAAPKAVGWALAASASRVSTPGNRRREKAADFPGAAPARAPYLRRNVGRGSPPDRRPTRSEGRMRLALLLALQSASQAAPAGPLAIDFDLARVKPAGPCATGAAGSDIVVCGRRPSGDYDMEKWQRVFRTDPLVAEKSIGPGTTAGVYVDSVAMPGGQVSKRALVGIKLGF
jgi:hypothetical protein